MLPYEKLKFHLKINFCGYRFLWNLKFSFTFARKPRARTIKTQSNYNEYFGCDESCFRFDECCSNYYLQNEHEVW